MRKVVVIGAGAAGMMAAISAAEHGAHTVVLEHKDRVGKKILSTGNGRCNFTNLVQTPQCYRSDDPKFPWRVITQFDEKKTVEFFQNIGVYAKNRNGYLYPNSDQAGAVLDSLRMEMERLCVEVHTECIFICGWGLCLSGYRRNSADAVWYFRDSGISGQSFCSKGALQQTGSNSGLKFYASDV